METDGGNDSETGSVTKEGRNQGPVSVPYSRWISGIKYNN